jgi:hypothetical protein
MDEHYIVIQWPEIQDLMDKEGFDENAFLINDEKGYIKFGDSAYFVNYDWFQNALNDEFK